MEPAKRFQTPAGAVCTQFDLMPLGKANRIDSTYDS